MSRRSYAGGAQQVELTGPVADIATQLPVTSLVGYPNGASGPFAIIVDKGETTEEKILIATASGGLMNVATRGYDGTIPRAHSQGASVRLVGTAIDFDEANAHINSATGVHGLAVNDAVVGVAKSQALANKTLDGDDNTFANIPRAASPETSDAIDDEAADRSAGDTARYTKTESDARYETPAGANAKDEAALDAHELQANPHPGYLTQSEGDAIYIPQDPVNPNLGRLPVSRIPVLHSGRRWETALSSLAATDAQPVKTIASLVASTPFPNNHASKFVMVTLTIKGFTTNGSDADFTRFNVLLDCPGGEWFGVADAQPIVQHRMTGNILTAANGFVVVGFCIPPAGNDFTVTAIFTKISGNPNPTNTAEGGLSAVQLV